MIRHFKGVEYSCEVIHTHTKQACLFIAWGLLLFSWINIDTEKDKNFWKSVAQLVIVLPMAVQAQEGEGEELSNIPKLLLRHR